MSTEKLDEILDIKPELTKTALLAAEPEPSAIKEAEPVDEHALVPTSAATPLAPTVIENDLTYARNKIKQIVDSAQITLESAIAVAEETGNPRAFEVVGTLLSSIVTANKELLQLHKTKADAVKTSAEGGEAAPKASGDVIIEKAVFVGRAQDFLRELRKTKIEIEQES